MINTFADVMRQVCTRPEMYVGERRFITVAAWLGGYSAGLMDCSAGHLTNVGLRGFRDWLANKFHKEHGIERNLGWFAYISRLYPDDDQALQQLPILFDEFVAERDSLLKDS